MRITIIALVAAAMVGLSVPAFAELQNVEVGGDIRIRGNWYSDAEIDFDDDGQDAFFFEQRTKLNVKADFTDDVTAFIELDNYELWGESGQNRGFDRANESYTTYTGTVSPLSGVDFSGDGNVALYQAYIEMREAWGYPLTFRIGRQEMQFGSEWLVGNNDTAAFFRGLSFDGIMGRYDHDQFSITGFWSRVLENQTTFFPEEAGDVDFMGIYGSYTGLEDMTIDGYWMFLRDPRDAFGKTDTATLHTIGVRFAGVAAGFDWDVEGAYQLGDTGLSSPADDISTFGITGEAGYTFDNDYQPRVFVKGAYLDGDDEEASFNRLFSDTEYSEFLANTDMSNVWLVGGGAGASITEQLDMSAVVTYFQAVEEFAADDDSIGLELAVYATYQYSEDLYFELGYAHFFPFDGVDGQTVPIAGNGLLPVGGGDDGMDYVYVETGISF